LELSLFILYIFVIILIIEVATMLLEATGLEKEVARFQAISLLTGTGYTTSESERVIKHPVRRKIASFLIIFGTISFAIIVSFVVSFIANGLNGMQLMSGVAVLAVLLFLFKSNLFKNRLLHNIEGRLEKKYLHQKSLEEIFDLNEEHVIREVTLTKYHDKFVGRSLKELKLADSGIRILTIRRGGKIIKNPTGSTRLEDGDILLLYGETGQIMKLFEKDKN